MYHLDVVADGRVILVLWCIARETLGVIDFTDFIFPSEAALDILKSGSADQPIVYAPETVIFAEDVICTVSLLGLHRL